MRHSIIARLVALLAVISLALFTATAAYASSNGANSKGKSVSSSQTQTSSDSCQDSDGKGRGQGHDKNKGNGHENHQGKGLGHKHSYDCDGEQGGSPDDVSDNGDVADNEPLIENYCAIYYAGQHTVVGSVCLTMENDTVFVDYTMVDGWKLSNPHLWVGDTLASAPRAGNGSPIPGQFPYNAQVNDVDGHSFTIPVSSLNLNADLLCTEGSSLLVAAHGEVSKNGQHESAWAGETRFTQKGSWATYFGVAPDCGDGPDDPVDPPVDPEPVQACTMWGASVTYDGTDISNQRPVQHLERLSTTGTDQEGVNAYISVGTVFNGRTSGLLVNASTILPPKVKNQTITFAQLSTEIDGTTVVRGTTYEAVPPAEGEFIQGVDEYSAFGSFTLSTDTSQFDVKMLITVCSTDQTDPPITN